MAHYAFLDENNIVTEVIVGIDETELIEDLSPEIWYGNFRNQTCIRTSYNGNIRKNYAGIEWSYDQTRDAFINPKPVVPPEDEQYVYFDEFACLWIYAPPTPNIEVTRV